MILNILLLIASGAILFWSANQIVKGVTFAANYFKWSEFVIAFFVMALAGALPNLFVGLSSVAHGIPELSFGDVVGSSVVDLTLIVAIAVFIGGGLSAKGKTVQASSVFAIFIAILPLLLILDGTLSRGDGIALILIFIAYTAWLITKRRKFSATFNNNEEERPTVRFRALFLNFIRMLIGMVLLLVAAEGMVRSMTFFAAAFRLPIILLGILVSGLGTSLPEAYFAITAARKGKGDIIMGDLMGSVIVASSLVLGIVAILQPIIIEDFSPFAIARFFVFFAALFFLLFVRTERRITKKEGIFLLGIYIAFVVAEIVSHSLGM
ncbi:MAG TPA: sodium:calcium antiporter [Candidatus Wildermuthbacteria bacterium]|nr:sodium:calcium antiporter [Candidatus Wildermuthbacteria bacterium]